MAAFATKDFGGEIPRQDPRNLPPNMAEVSVNCDLAAGPLDGLSQPEYIVDLSGAPYPVRKAWRFPGPNVGDPALWVPLPSEFSSVCRSPLANDTLNRVYWTNSPGQPAAGAFWNTYDRIRTGQPAWSIGFCVPDPGITLSVTPAGGDTSVPQITRSYCFTYIDQYNQESSPTNPSATVDGAPDGTWTVSGLPASPPPNPPGRTYPPVVKMRLYRTLAGSGTGAQFYFVADINFGASTYVDSIPDTTVVNNNLLESTSWAPPPDGLDGLTAMTGGMLIGFTGNTIHFCEPDRPHAWPVGYDQSLHYKILALAVWQQALTVLTSGFPSSGTGNSPAQFAFAQIQAPEPCISRGSVVTDLAGVYYASQNGLVMLNYYGMQNQTLSNMTKTLWLTEYKAADIIACRHRASYLAINGTGEGFVIDYTEARMGITHISPVQNVVSVWNDDFTGDAYMMADNVVYRWDSPNTPPLTYRWRSKQFYLPHAASFGACHISLDPSVTDPAPLVATSPLSNDRSVVLPSGVNAVFKLYAGPDGQHLVCTKSLSKARSIFRVTGGFKAFNWQFELISRVPVHSVELASTMRELEGV